MLMQHDKRKVFFFEKKKQKTFVPFALPPIRHCGHGAYISGQKVFWFFFSKKNNAKLCFI